MELVALLVTFITALRTVAYETPKTVVNDVSQKIGDIMVQCGRKMYPKYYVDADIDSFWDPDYNIEDSRLGCLAVCSMRKLKLCQKNGQMNPANIKRFIVANDADPHTVTVLEDLFRYCYESSSFTNMTCTVGLSALVCYRTSIEKLGWSPGIY